MADRTCSYRGCDREILARGWCSMHYGRWSRNGTPDDIRPTDADRFWAKVDRKGAADCWLWMPNAKTNGYGQFGIGGKLHKKMVYAHRFSYELAHGSIPEGLHLDHLCRVRLCVNPAHLEAVTPGENSRRGWRDATDCRICGSDRKHWTKQLH